MIGCLRTCVRKQPIIAFYFEFENELKFYNLGTGLPMFPHRKAHISQKSVSLFLCIFNLFDNERLEMLVVGSPVLHHLDTCLIVLGINLFNLWIM